MRSWLILLLAALLAGCADAHEEGVGQTSDSSDDAAPGGAPSDATAPDGTNPDPADPPGEPPRKRLQASGAAGDWVIAIQRFSGEVTEFDMEYEASFRTTAGANVLQIVYVTNHAGDWGLSDLFNEVVDVSAGEFSRSGFLAAGGQDYRGVATAWASDAPWSVDVRLDPNVSVRDLIILRGSGATFTTSVGQTGATPLQFEVLMDLPVGQDDLVIVQPDVGDPVMPFGRGSAPRSEWIPELPNGDRCNPVLDATVFRDHPAAGDWGQPGALHAVLRTDGWVEPPAIRAISIPLAGAQLPSGWDLGSFCNAHG